MSINLNTIKTQIKSVLDTANTTTASVDLSSGLETRVQRVLTVNPGRIPVQSSWYPFVSIFIDSKNLEMKDIAINQINAKRRADINIKIVGAVWNSTVTDETKDPADDDCEKLMEQIEEIIRRNPTIDSNLLYSFPTDVTYHSANLDEESHLRIGILNLRGTIYY